jgi:hypothetical protein
LDALLDVFTRCFIAEVTSFFRGRVRKAAYANANEPHSILAAIFTQDFALFGIQDNNRSKGKATPARRLFRSAFGTNRANRIGLMMSVVRG